MEKILSTGKYFFSFFRLDSDCGDCLLANYATELLILKFWLGGGFLVVSVLCCFKKIEQGKTKMVTCILYGL